MALVPDDVASDFTFLEDDPTGDFRQYHLYLYFKTEPRAGSTGGKFHHSWKISGSQFAESSDKEALKTRRRTEEMKVFEKQIRQSLMSEGKRLVRNEEGICKVDG
jgi:hypothetical protein